MFKEIKAKNSLQINKQQAIDLRSLKTTNPGKLHTHTRTHIHRIFKLLKKKSLKRSWSSQTKKGHIAYRGTEVRIILDSLSKVCTIDDGVISLHTEIKEKAIDQWKYLS